MKVASDVLLSQTRNAIWKREHRKKNVERCRQTGRLEQARRRERFPDKVREESRIRRLKNKERIREQKAASQVRNGPRWNKMMRDKYSTDPEIRRRRCDAARAWRKAHPEKCKLREQLRRGRTKLERALRNRVRKVLKGISKSASTMELIGCSLGFLRSHFETQFKDGMTWENFGSYWHHDHIVPCASFDLSNPDEQRRCFNWQNLRPLEARENISKGAKILSGHPCLPLAFSHS